MNAQLLTIAHILQMRDGDPIPAIVVQFKKIGDYKDGENSNGPWSIQNCTVTDGANECKLKLFNRPELTRDWVNVSVLFQASPGQKKPWLGLTKETDDYRNRQTTMIKADDRARMEQYTNEVAARLQQAQTAQPPVVAPPTQPALPALPTSQAAQQHAVQPPPQNAAPVAPVAPVAPPVQSKPEPQHTTQTSRRVAPAPGSPEDQKECIRKARVYTGKLANSLLIAFDAAMYVGRNVDAKHKLQLTSEEIQRIAVSINIALERGGYVDGLPEGQMEYNPKPQSTDPANATVKN